MMQIFLRLGIISLAAVLLLDTTGRAEFCGPGKGNHCHRARRGKYKKWTRTSNEIREYSNVKIREFKAKRLGLPPPPIRSELKEPEICTMPSKSCDDSMFRSIDGTCNNVQNPYWGAVDTQMNRLLPAAYQDGIDEPRGGYNNSNLPDPRTISATIHPDLVDPDPAMTNMVPQFGQFLDHDLTLAPEPDLPCCTSASNDMDCFPIPVSPDDEFYSQFNVRCLDFSRSTAYCFPGESGIREQFSAVTAFADCSNVYGSHKGRTDCLREFNGGRLLANSENPVFLPFINQTGEGCRDWLDIEGVYAAGDDRVNEMPGLTTMHTLFFNEHNRVAAIIGQLRPTWTDEQIFQWARRIVIAEWKNIIYSEYLPVILGAESMDRYNLRVDSADCSTYDANIKPAIFNEFATVAYRFGHTLINGLIRLFSGMSEKGSYRVRDNYFNPSQINRDGGKGYDYILWSLMQQEAQTYDRFVTEDFTNFLFPEPEYDFGSDLIARNIQRAREHGLPVYNEFRRLCDLSPLTDWEDCPPEILPETWDKLRSVYRHPHDIDPFTGGICETVLPGAASGPTFNCIKGMQFHRLKFGDRYFFTHCNQSGSFTMEQVSIVKRRTLGDIICENSEVNMTTRTVFKAPSDSTNPWVPCNDPSRTTFDISLLLPP